MTTTTAQPAPAPAKRSRSRKVIKRTPVVIPASELQVGDLIGGEREVAKVQIGTVRTWAWDAAGKELVYILNIVRIEVER